MDDDQYKIWREAALWPAASVSVYQQIKSGDVNLKDKSEGLSSYATSSWQDEEIIQSDKWKLKCVLAIDAFFASPNSQTARDVYAALSAGYLSPYGKYDFAKDHIKPITDKWQNFQASKTLAVCIEHILRHSPHMIAICNAIYFSSYTKIPIDTDFVMTFGLNTNMTIADQACIAIERQLPKSVEKERLVFSLAERGSEYLKKFVLANTTPQSDREIKDWILKRLFANPWPHGYVIEDYIDYIVEYMEKVDLLSALKEDSPADFIITGALEIYSHVIRGIRYVDEEEIEILVRLIDHLIERELSFEELENLSNIYSLCFPGLVPDEFSVRDAWYVHAEGESYIPEFAQDRNDAKTIWSVFEYQPNKEKIEAALVSTDNEKFYTAFEIIEDLEKPDLFEIIFKAVQNASDPQYLSKLAEHIKTESQARSAIDWAISRFRISEDGHSPFAGKRYNEILHALIGVAGEYPGVGGPLILAGFNHGTTAHDQAAEALLKWDIEYWPEGAKSQLNQAIRNTTRTLDLLNEAIGKIDDK